MHDSELIAAADKVTAHFGHWPSFHDAEVVSVRMGRRGPAGPWAELVVHVWAYTGRRTPTGHFEQDRHARVRFRCDGLAESRLDGFNHQNVLRALHVRPSAEGGAGVTMDLPSSFGLGGFVACDAVRVVDVVAATPAGAELHPAAAATTIDPDA